MKRNRCLSCKNRLKCKRGSHGKIMLRIKRDKGNKRGKS